MLGLTNVHVNRMLRQLNDEGIIDGMHTRFTIIDENRLSSLAVFKADFVKSPSWLPQHIID